MIAEGMTFGGSMKKRIRIFLDGVSFTHRSLGDQAMSIATVILLNNCFPSAELSFLSTRPEIEYKRCEERGFNIRVAQRSQSFVWAFLSLLREYSRSDLIIGVYGDGFTEKRHLRSFSLLSKLYLDFVIKLLLVNVTNN